MEKEIFFLFRKEKKEKELFLYPVEKKKKLLYMYIQKKFFVQEKDKSQINKWFVDLLKKIFELKYKENV